MPCSFVIDKERRLESSTAWDHLTFAETKNHQNQLFSDPDFDPEFDQLIDAAAVTKWDISVEEAKMMARRSFFSPTSRRAFVATAPDVFGMERLMQAYHDMGKTQEQVSVFYNRNEALKWLGLDALPR
jgi:hypothetical protein